MTRLDDNEPDHWHDDDGRHRMKDLRTVFGDKWNNASGDWGDRDERAFTHHLIAHETRITSEKPLPTDSPEILAILARIETDRAIISKQLQLVAALRQHQRINTKHP